MSDYFKTPNFNEWNKDAWEQQIDDWARQNRFWYKCARVWKQAAKNKNGSLILSKIALYKLSEDNSHLRELLRRCKRVIETKDDIYPLEDSSLLGELDKELEG